ncbi:hypothetical protein VaNZ11_009247, partial [Volvox africanus]
MDVDNPQALDRKVKVLHEARPPAPTLLQPPDTTSPPCDSDNGAPALGTGNAAAVATGLGCAAEGKGSALLVPAIADVGDAVLPLSTESFPAGSLLADAIADATAGSAASMQDPMETEHSQLNQQPTHESQQGKVQQQDPSKPSLGQDALSGKLVSMGILSEPRRDPPSGGYKGKDVLTAGCLGDPGQDEAPAPRAPLSEVLEGRREKDEQEQWQKDEALRRETEQRPGMELQESEAELQQLQTGTEGAHYSEPAEQQLQSAEAEEQPMETEQQQEEEEEEPKQDSQQPRRPTRRRVAPTKLSDSVSARLPQQHSDGIGATAGGGGSGGHKGGGLPRTASALQQQDTAGAGGGTSAGEGRPTKRSRVHQVSEERLQEEVVQAVGLDPWGLSEEEEALLSDVESQRPGQPPLGRHQYLKIRNLILTMWRLDPRRHLTMEAACKAVPTQCTRHAEVAWSYLHSYGFINFGLAVASVPDMEHEETIIVIGAGLAGLAAAQQLRQLGYRVLVLEARIRPGGRVHTARMEAGGVTGFAELGGSIITGCDGNPLAVLANQIGVSLQEVRSETPLYWEDGRPVDEALDQQVTQLYNEVLTRCDTLCHQLGPRAGELISVEAALSAIWPEVSAAAHLRDRNGGSAGGAAAAAAQSSEAGSAGAGTDNEDSDKLPDHLFNWHVANLEFANAAQASQLSLRHWAQDDAYELQGAHTFTAGGNSRLVQLLTQNLPIMYGCPVRDVRYSSGGSNGGVTVVTEAGTVFEAAAAVVTLPLGVLKTETVRFSPPLPAAKQEAIKRLGYGRLNKVSLLFPYVFWDPSVDTFACAMRAKERRGEYYLFYCGAYTGGAAVLTALVAGSAAIAIESISDEQAVAQVMRVLRNIFDRPHDEAEGSAKAAGTAEASDGAKSAAQQEKLGGGGGSEAAAAAAAGTTGTRKLAVPEPLQAIVTRWGSDPYSLGSYSSMAVSCRGAAEYQAMAAPVGGRLFFAGEATMYKYPATMHGAFLSGLREAGRIHYTFARARHGLPPRADGFTGAAEGGGDVLAAATGDCPPVAAPPSGPALRHVRRLAALGGNLRALFSAVEPDLEFGCFKGLFGPEVPGKTQWALLQIDLGCLRSRTASSSEAEADDADVAG